MRHTGPDYERPRALYMPRTRGAVTGLLLILLGAWGALIPFIGPIFNWAYTADPAWTWTAAKGWLEVLPGVAAAVGGLLLLVCRKPRQRHVRRLAGCLRRRLVRGRPGVRVDTEYRGRRSTAWRRRT